MFFTNALVWAHNDFDEYVVLKLEISSSVAVLHGSLFDFNFWVPEGFTS